nr:MAG TPA_asm: hypothetical protein [Caudoviricetes sp.]
MGHLSCVTKTLEVRQRVSVTWPGIIEHIFKSGGDVYSKRSPGASFNRHDVRRLRWRGKVSGNIFPECDAGSGNGINDLANSRGYNAVDVAQHKLQVLRPIFVSGWKGKDNGTGNKRYGFAPLGNRRNVLITLTQIMRLAANIDLQCTNDDLRPGGRIKAVNRCHV